MNKSIGLKQSQMKPLKTEPELFDLCNQLKIWAIEMYHITATKEQKKYDPIELIIRFQWDNIHVNHEKPEYYDNITMKLPKSHILFSTTFKNNTDTEQEYNFRTERCTRSIAEIEIQKGVLLSNELSIKLSLPSSIMEANAGFKHEISIGSSTRQSTEEELSWGVDSRIIVPARHSASAEVKIEEEEMNCCFRLRTTISYT
ncbi:LIN 24 Twenty four Like family member [Schistosoma japonicum]|nr:LIN 24 Twenty four Like family member [Schistosoma japonicum]